MLPSSVFTTALLVQTPCCDSDARKLVHPPRVTSRSSRTAVSDEHLSNYRTANTSFRARNGTYRRDGQIPDGETGGMKVYDTSPYDNSKVTAFEPGFRVMAGNAEQRTDDGVMRRNSGIET
ncbi:hypothetical protein F4775DRAFT_596325 [Biscogniauxia sp. FL1348]|nr:hypothetical protein F4775DRAFT_596325 [Biscogniauxia sp. FL1348]